MEKKNKGQPDEESELNKDELKINNQEKRKEKFKSQLIQNLYHLQALTHSKKKRENSRFVNVFKNLHINTTFSEAFKQLLIFSKKILTKKNLLIKNSSN